MTIRPIEERDRSAVIDMMRRFYASPAVSTDGSEEIFEANVDGCLSDTPYIEGYVFECGELIGYGMLAKSYSTEFGKSCVWIEDIYLEEGFRKRGYGSEFIRYVIDKYPNSLIRLEVEEDNEGAVRAYQKNGFTYLPYKEMKRG